MKNLLLLLALTIGTSNVAFALEEQSVSIHSDYANGGAWNPNEYNAWITNKAAVGATEAVTDTINSLFINQPGSKTLVCLMKYQQAKGFAYIYSIRDCHNP